MVLLENKLSSQWDFVLKDLYGPGSNLENGGIQFKLENMTISIRTKLVIQGGKDKEEIFEYVFSSLPNIYQRVITMCKKEVVFEKKEVSCDNLVTS